MRFHKNLFLATVAAISLPMTSGEVDLGPPLDQKKVEIASSAFEDMKKYWLAQGMGVGAVKLMFLREKESACGIEGSQATALYCGRTKEIIFTDEVLNVLDKKQAGFTSVVTFVVGHELGHAVQDAENISHETEFTKELQASCLSGTVMQAVYPERIPYEELKWRDDTEAYVYSLGVNGEDCFDTDKFY
jgi:predicted metalloprotease